MIKYFTDNNLDLKVENYEKNEKESQQLCIMKTEMDSLKEELSKTKQIITMIFQ